MKYIHFNFDPILFYMVNIRFILIRLYRKIGKQCMCVYHFDTKSPPGGPCSHNYY